MSVTSGRTSLRQFAFFDPDSSCWRTWPAISLWGSETFSGTLPKRGSMRSGRLFERATSAHATSAPDFSSLLPAPTAWEQGNDSKFLDRREALKAKGYNGNGAGMPLDVAVRMLPTPTAGDAKSAANRTAGRSNPESAHHDGVTLTDAVRLLPTPTARDHKGQNQRRDTSCLPGAITQMPSSATPESSVDEPPTLWTERAG